MENDTEEHRRSAGIRRATDLPEPPPPLWLAIGWLLRAAVNVLVGDEGIGKSLFWVTVAMHVTTGKPEPTLRLPGRDPGDVVVIATEDSWSEIRARLETAGADLDRVHLFCDADDELGIPEFPRDLLKFQEWAAESGVKPALIVVDAWLDTVPPGVQVKQPQGARTAMAPWKAIAKQTEAAVLLMTHTNRMGGVSVRDRIGATAELRKVARTLIFAARHADDGRDGEPLHLWIGPEKVNGAKLPNAVRFELSIEKVRQPTESDPGTVATLIAPRQQTQTIAHLVADWTSEQEQSNRKPTRAEEAEAWLLAHMQGHPVDLSTNVQRAGKEAGFGREAVSTAMRAIGKRTNTGPGTPWLFSLGTAESGDSGESPAQSPQSPQSLHSPVSPITTQ